MKLFNTSFILALVLVLRNVIAELSLTEAQMEMIAEQIPKILASHHERHNSITKVFYPGGVKKVKLTQMYATTHHLKGQSADPGWGYGYVYENDDCSGDSNEAVGYVANSCLTLGEGDEARSGMLYCDLDTGQCFYV
jgi:hypothetical protein